MRRVCVCVCVVQVAYVGRVFVCVSDAVRCHCRRRYSDDDDADDTGGGGGGSGGRRGGAICDGGGGCRVDGNDTTAAREATTNINGQND